MNSITASSVAWGVTFLALLLGLYAISRVRDGPRYQRQACIPVTIVVIMSCVTWIARLQYSALDDEDSLLCLWLNVCQYGEIAYNFWVACALLGVRYAIGEMRDDEQKRARVLAIAPKVCWAVLRYMVIMVAIVGAYLLGVGEASSDSLVPRNCVLP